MPGEGGESESRREDWCERAREGRGDRAPARRKLLSPNDVESLRLLLEGLLRKYRGRK